MSNHTKKANDILVADLRIFRDDGNHRHICIGKENLPRSKDVEIMTWSGHLCLTGGKGSYLFKSPSYSDMFDAFREYGSEKIAENGKLMVNVGRLAEWVVATDAKAPRANSPLFLQACSYITWAVARYDYEKKLIPLNKAIAEAEKRARNQPDDQGSRLLVGWLKDYRDTLKKQGVQVSMITGEKEEALTLKKAEKEIEHLRQQRDELLAALERVVEDWVNPGDGGAFEDGEMPALDIARAAIASVKGGVA